MMIINNNIHEYDVYVRFRNNTIAISSEVEGNRKMSTVRGLQRGAFFFLQHKYVRKFCYNCMSPVTLMKWTSVANRYFRMRFFHISYYHEWKSIAIDIFSLTRLQLLSPIIWLFMTFAHFYYRRIKVAINPS